jgi:cytochrome c-type biogenesis protein CcmH/NrfG
MGKNEDGTEAAEALKKALEKDPLNGTFYVELAETNGLRSGEEPSEEAVKLCKLALEVDPDNSDVYFALWRFDALRKLLDESSKN